MLGRIQNTVTALQTLYYTTAEYILTSNVLIKICFKSNYTILHRTLCPRRPVVGMSRRTRVWAVREQREAVRPTVFGATAERC